jgi:hypothetical protein
MVLAAGNFLGIGNDFWNGVVGGLAAYAIVHALPFGVGLQRGQKLKITGSALLGVFIVLAAFLGLGGLASVILTKATDGTQQQIIYGIGFQSTIGGALQGIKATRRRG